MDQLQINIMRLLAGLLIALCLSGAALAQASEVSLGIKPVDGGEYIELTVSPGEQRELTVELGNYGDAPVQAHTYAADVYSLVNGGLGIRLDGEPISGTTRWIDYETTDLLIEPGTAVRRSFSLHVPADAQPGQYMTSVVLQSAKGSPVGSGAVNIKQVTRQAMTIVLTIPGPQHPAFEIGTPSHRFVGGRSVIGIDIRNTGNVRVRPSGSVVLHDAAGNEVSRFPITMGPIYAGTSTTLEIPFAGVLNSGEYTIGVELGDEKTGVTPQSAALDIQVHPSEAAAPDGAPSSAPQMATINQLPEQSAQTPEQMTQPASPMSSGGLSTPEIIFGVVMLALILIAARQFFRSRR